MIWNKHQFTAIRRFIIFKSRCMGHTHLFYITLNCCLPNRWVKSLYDWNGYHKFTVWVTRRRRRVDASQRRRRGVDKSLHNCCCEGSRTLSSLSQIRLHKICYSLFISHFYFLSSGNKHFLLDVCQPFMSTNMLLFNGYISLRRSLMKNGVQ